MSDIAPKSPSIAFPVMASPSFDSNEKFNNAEKESASSKSQRKSTSLPSETVEYLKAWMMSPEHINHPYPTEQEKCQIMVDTDIELKQLTNWFVNNRKRYWKPRVEARLQQAKAAHAAAAATVAAHAVTEAVARQMGMHAANITRNGHFSHGPSMSYPQGVHFVPDHQQIAAVAAASSMLPGLDRHIPMQMFRFHTVSESSHATSGESDNSISNDEEEDFDLRMKGASDSICTLDDSYSPPPHQMQQFKSHSMVPNRTSITNLHQLECDIFTEKQSSQVEPELVSLYSNTTKSSSATSSDHSSVPEDTLICKEDASIIEPYRKCARISVCDNENQLQPSRNQDNSYSSQKIQQKTVFLNQNMETWSNTCRKASDCSDDSLPSLDDAAHMFGFSKKRRRAI